MSETGLSSPRMVGGTRCGGVMLGAALYYLPEFLNGGNDGQPPHQFHFFERWRYAGFCLWDRERVEALKGLDMFAGQLDIGWT